MQEFLHIEFNSPAILNDGTEYLPVHFGLVWSSVRVRRGVGRFTDTGSLKRVNTRNESGKPTVFKKEVTEAPLSWESLSFAAIEDYRWIEPGGMLGNGVQSVQSLFFFFFF